MFRPPTPAGYPIRLSNLTHPLITKATICQNALSLGFSVPLPSKISKAKLIPLYMAGVRALPKGKGTTPDDLILTIPHIPSAACASLGITYPDPTGPNAPSASCALLGISCPTIVGPSSPPAACASLGFTGPVDGPASPPYPTLTEPAAFPAEFLTAAATSDAALDAWNSPVPVKALRLKGKGRASRS